MLCKASQALAKPMAVPNTSDYQCIKEGVHCTRLMQQTKLQMNAHLVPRLDLSRPLPVLLRTCRLPLQLIPQPARSSACAQLEAQRLQQVSNQTVQLT